MITTHRMLYCVLAHCGFLGASTFAADIKRRRSPLASHPAAQRQSRRQKLAYCEVQYTLAANGKTAGPINLTGNVNTKITAADDKQSTRRMSFTKFDSKNDTIGLAEMMNKEFAAQFNANITSDARGNTLKQIGTNEPPDSYNFPAKAVKVGDTWQSWLGMHETKKPITYTLEKIIRIHGDDIAVTSKQSPAWQGQVHKDIEWFDVTKGDFIGCTIDQVKTTPHRNDRLLDLRYAVVGEVAGVARPESANDVAVIRAAAF